ncbi:MAG: DUF4342 domain-containing protein [Eubacteriales bacterium]|nr:DUF4342 domain-containing protein [Eubacteriales bacterium]
MEITLEKIELVKDRTGVTYAEAKEALENADGNVVDAIIALEESVDEETSTKRLGEQGEALIEKIKEIVKRGNVSRIVVSHNDEKILNLPVNAGIFGVVVAPWGILVAVIAAFGFKCRIEIVKTDGSIIDVSRTAEGALDKAQDIAIDAKGKVQDVSEKAKDVVKETAEKMKEKTPESVKQKTEQVGMRFGEKIRFGKKHPGDINVDELFDEGKDAASDQGVTEQETKDEESDPFVKYHTDASEAGTPLEGTNFGGKHPDGIHTGNLADSASEFSKRQSSEEGDSSKDSSDEQ